MPAVGWFGSGWWRSLAWALGAWALTRLTLGAIGAYSFRLDGHPIPWLTMWVQWDSSYYLSIAEHGYLPPVVVTGLEDGQSNLNFFPFLPIGIALFGLIIPSPVLAGLVFTNACLIGAAVLHHRLATLKFGPAAGDWAVLSLMTLPGSFALSGISTESSFLLLSVAAAFFTVRGRYGPAALGSALLTVTKLTGIVQGTGMALDWMIARIRGQPASYRRLFLLALIPLPMLADMAFMFHLTHDALAPEHSNFVFWQHELGVPFTNYAMMLWTTQPRLEVQSVVALILTAAMLSQWRHFTPGEWFFVLVTIASFASSESASPSFIRYTLALYPLHLAMGRLCAGHPLARALLLSLAMIDGALAAPWFHGSELYV